jgi:hypothetical protein
MSRWVGAWFFSRANARVDNRMIEQGELFHPTWAQNQDRTLAARIERFNTQEMSSYKCDGCPKTFADRKYWVRHKHMGCMNANSSKHSGR